MATAEPDGSCCRLEFAVQMRCQSCAEAVRAALQGAPGVRLLELRLASQTLLVETTAPAKRVRELLEHSGRRAVLRGAGGCGDGGLGSAVAALAGPAAARGLVRFVQLTPTRCLVEGEVGGLPPGPHGLHVHEFGDLSRPCDSCGDHYNPDGDRHGGPQDQHRHVGDLGNIWADAEGRASFRMEDLRLKVWDIIGRSVVVAAGEDDLGRGSHPLSGVTGNSGAGAGLRRGGPLCRALPEPQAGLLLRRADPLGGAGPRHGGPRPHGHPPPLGAAAPPGTAINEISLRSLYSSRGSGSRGLLFPAVLGAAQRPGPRRPL